MSREIKANHDQIFLLPPAIEDWVPVDHPVRFIREFVKQLSLEKLGFPVRRKSDDGAPSYSSELLLGAWIYGYFYKVYSSRKLESSCRKEMPLIWLTGCNYPDHNTLWRFWRDNSESIKRIFRETVLTADQMGMVGMVVNAVDGTKIHSESSRRSMWSKKSLSKKLKEVEVSIATMEKMVNESENGIDENLPSRLQNKKKLQLEIKEALEKLKELEKNNYHPNEPEAAVMQSGRTVELSYNAQAAVDADHKIIVASEVTNEENDSNQMIPMLEKVEETIGKRAEETVFDAGYDTANQIVKADELQYSILVNDRQKRAKENKFHTAHFQYDKETDTVICPVGSVLKFERNRIQSRTKTPTKVFRCKNKTCPLRSECSKDPRGRYVETYAFQGAIDKQNEKRKSNQGKELLRKRGGIVEPVFAFIKSNNGFRRFTYRSLDKVSTQWKMLCAIENLKRIYSFTIATKAPG